ncbi:MAG: hypothetical protein WC711_01140 [Candidatus Staskawiczbacteria bacterium]|jgi:hypothetical protein
MNINVFEHPLFWSVIFWISYFIMRSNVKELRQWQQNHLRDQAPYPLGMKLVSILGRLLMATSVIMMLIVYSPKIADTEIYIMGVMTLVFVGIVLIQYLAKNKKVQVRFIFSLIRAVEIISVIAAAYFWWGMRVHPELRSLFGALVVIKAQLWTSLWFVPIVTLFEFMFFDSSKVTNDTIKKHTRMLPVFNPVISQITIPLFLAFQAIKWAFRAIRTK